MHDTLLLLVVVYLAISVGIGLFAASKVRNARDYVNAGRNLPLFIVFSLVFATWFGSETVLGIPGAFLKDDGGTAALISDPLGAGVCLILFGLIFARPLYRMNLLTLGDFFRIRYNRRVELVLSICIVVSYLGWVSAQITALGLVFDLLSGGLIGRNMGMIIGASVVLIYTLYGGMWSVAVTTFVQMIIIILGLVYITWVANDMAGGVAPVVAHAVAAGKFDISFSFSRDTFIWIAAFFTLAFGSIPQQDVFQRANSSKSERTAVWGTTLGGIFYVIFAIVPIYLAYTALIIDPAMVEAVAATDEKMETVMPTLVMSHMSFASQVIFFGALLSVIMSTASGTLLAPSVTFSENVLRNFYPRMTDKQFLRVTRATVAVFSILVTLYAIVTDSSIHDMVVNAYRITLAAALVPLVAGLFWKRANNTGAALSIGMGLTFWLVAEVLVYAGILSDMLEPQIYGLFASIAGMIIGATFGPVPTRKVNQDAVQASNGQPAEQTAEHSPVKG
jgi:SSS family transporter